MASGSSFRRCLGLLGGPLDVLDRATGRPLRVPPDVIAPFLGGSAA